MASRKRTDQSTIATLHEHASWCLNARSVYLTFVAYLGVVCPIIPQHVSACSVPVFRYALERWLPDIYPVKFFHDKPLTDEQLSWLASLPSANTTSDSTVNLNLEIIDVNNLTDDGLLSQWKQNRTQSPPSLMVSYPIGHYNRKPFWTTDLTETNIQKITDSPIRREIARRLLKGESAVWVLLESGQIAKDQQAYNRLSERLEYLNNELELPALDPADVEDGLISIDEDELNIAFSTLRVSRDDPSESFFIEMLLGTEGDLRTFNEPMAFPIFGRGRALYALIGEGITPTVIDEACVFLTGACSCEVKEQNPGVDLLMSVDWDHLITRQLEVDRELPPLAGLVTLEQPSLPNPTQETALSEPIPESEASVEHPQDSPSILFTTVVVCAGIGGVALLGSFFLLRRK